MNIPRRSSPPTHLTPIATLLVLWACVGPFAPIPRAVAESATSAGGKVRVAAVQAGARSVPFRFSPDEALATVETNLGHLERLVDQAAEKKCEALCFPEDTLGLLHWLGMNETAQQEVLPTAVRRMTERLGAAAARRRMHLVACSDHLEKDGEVYNTAFLIGPDGKEIGRYHKTCPTWSESGTRRRGSTFPVFQTPALGGVGMLICYDLVMPETARCLALNGAGIIFFPTMGGAAIGDDDIGVQALRVRAVENFIWLVVAQRGNGAMIISPQGKIVAKAEGPDGFAIADIDPFGGREGGDALNHQKDMRARLFRERNPSAFGILSAPNPPILDSIPIELSAREAADISARALTLGEEEFRAARALQQDGKTEDAITAFIQLRKTYRGSWIDRAASNALAQLKPAPQLVQAGSTIASLSTSYPGDLGIENDSRVVFAESFEDGSIEEIAKRWTESKNPAGQVLKLVDDAPKGSPGRRALQITATLGKDDGGYLYRRFAQGYDMLHARFYVKFAEDASYPHHFVALGGYNPPTDWPQGGAGQKPRGDDRIYIGIEPHGSHGAVPPPGAWSFYNYWHEMKVSADGRYWGQAISPQQPLMVPKSQWQCVEVRVKLNTTPDRADGELDLWLDGAKVMHVAQDTRIGPWTGMGFQLPDNGGGPFQGFRWRTTTDLKLNWFWLLHYVTPSASRQNNVSKPNPVLRVWFDHVVIATEYIGPIIPPTRPAKP